MKINLARPIQYFLLLLVPAALIIICTGNNNAEAPDQKIEKPCPQEPKEKPIIIWHYHSIRDTTDSLKLALSSGLITHVSIGGTLHRRDLNYWKNPRTLQAITIVKNAGAKFIWLRLLWPIRNVESSSAEDLFDPNYYIQEIRSLRTEGMKMGADFVALDVEAYGKTPLKKYLIGRNRLTKEQEQELEHVIKKVIKTVGKVDFILPIGDVPPENPTHIISELGKNRISETTYYDNKELLARIKYPYEIFGVYLNTIKKNKEHPKLPLYLPREIFDRSQLWSDKKGLFIFPKENRALEVARELVAYSRTLPDKKTFQKIKE